MLGNIVQKRAWNCLGQSECDLCIDTSLHTAERNTQKGAQCIFLTSFLYEGVSKSYRTGRLERVQQMVQLSATRCRCIAILWVSLVSFAAVTLCVAFQRGFIVVSVYFLIDSVRKLLDTPSYNLKHVKEASHHKFLQGLALLVICLGLVFRVHFLKPRVLQKRSSQK
jgi:hypothetical protein